MSSLGPTVRRMKAKSVLSHYDVDADVRDLLREVARMDGYVEVVSGGGRPGGLVEIRADSNLKTGGHNHGR